MEITPVEQAIFYILTFAAIGYMLWQIMDRVNLWRKGRPLVPEDQLRKGWRYYFPSWEAWRRWQRNLSTFILGQKKVRGQRKKSGAPMHLLIFYGFVTLTIGTILLAINTYSPVKFHQGLYYIVYEITLDVMGLAFVVGVVWAFIRRTKMSQAELGAAALRQEPETEADKAQYAKQMEQGRRRPMSHSLNDYFTLGLLFLLGVTGFVLEGARMVRQSVNSPEQVEWHWASPVGNVFAGMMQGLSMGAYKGLWWFHIVLVLVFFAVIPRMRIRHIVMAMFSAAGKPERPMGELAPISMEEVEQTGQIGVAEPKDYSRWHLMSLDACMECGRCTEVCPAWKVGKVLNPKQVVQDVRGAMKTDENVISAVSEEALWACTTCNACVEACPVLIRQVDLIVDARRNLVAEGRLSGTAAVMLRQTGSTGNAWGAPASSREDWMKGMDIPLCRDGVEFEWLFWVGCAGATDPGAVKTTKAVAELLKKAGVSFACLGQEEACTGDPARRVGDEFLFQEKAMENVSVFQRYGVKKVVTPCPHCFNTLKHEYRQFPGEQPDWQFEEVVHHSQLLQQLIESGKLQAPQAGGDTVFHDPCYLGRVNNESDAPRAVLGSKTNYNNHPPDAHLPPSRNGLAEPANRARKTLCCGAGGGRMWMEEPPNQRPGNRRAKELLETGAKTVAVGCPFCRIMLDASIKQETHEEIRLVDIAEALREANS
jgi:Fe-S oxidoreductase